MATKTRIKKVLVNSKICTGCRICETVCSLVNEGECNPTLARLHVLFDPFTAKAQVEVGPRCTLCQECIKWCPVQALSAGYSKDGGD